MSRARYRVRTHTQARPGGVVRVLQGLGPSLAVWLCLPAGAVVSRAHTGGRS